MPHIDGELMLRAIPPTDLAFDWPRVRAGLEEILCKSPDEWLPEDVYMAIKQGSATLFIGEDEHGDYLGFLVLQLLPMHHGQRLHIWHAHSATDRPLMAMFLPEIKQLAHQAKAKKITFQSRRSEWERVSGRLGFETGLTTYEMEV